MKAIQMPSSNGFDKLHKQGVYIPYSLMYELGDGDETLIVAQFQSWLNSKHSGRFMPICVDTNDVAVRNCKWARDSLSELQSVFKIWSHPKIIRLINKLVRRRILLVADISKTFQLCKVHMNFAKFDKTRWFTLNNTKLQKMYEDCDYARDANLVSKDKSQHKVVQNVTTRLPKCHTRSNKSYHAKSQIVPPKVTNRTNDNLGSHLGSQSRESSRSARTSKSNNPDLTEPRSENNSEINSKPISSAYTLPRQYNQWSAKNKSYKRTVDKSLKATRPYATTVDLWYQYTGRDIGNGPMATKLHILCKVFGNSLVNFAMQVTDANGIKYKHWLNYMKSCLKNWHKKGITSAGMAKKYKSKHKFPTATNTGDDYFVDNQEDTEAAGKRAEAKFMQRVKAKHPDWIQNA